MFVCTVIFYVRGQQAIGTRSQDLIQSSEVINTHPSHFCSVLWHW